MKPTLIHIACAICQAEAGTVEEVVDPSRPGFFHNVCTPDVLPSYCEKCGGHLVRL